MSNPILQNFINQKKSVGIANALAYYDIIVEMINSDGYSYADDFLVSLLKQIDEKEIITEKQIEAVENIRRKARTKKW